METWKRNLAVCWLCGVIMAVGTSQIAPILPLYIEELGVHGAEEVARWSGIAFGVNFISLAVFSPIWGKAADRYGCKPMIVRASLWLAIIMFAMAYVRSVHQLVGLRVLQGAMSGFFPAMITFVAKQTPTDKVGWAIGTLSTGQVAGLLFGPLFGGALADVIGFRNVFSTIAALAFLAALGSIFLIRENFVRAANAAADLRETWRLIPDAKLLAALFATSFVLQASTMSIQPIISVYVSTLVPDNAPVALIAGAIFAAMGLANVLAAPRLGRLCDRVGEHRVMLCCLVFAGIFYLPQALAATPLELGILLFLVGATMGGLVPSINALVKKNVPDEVVGRAFGYNQTAQHLGAFTGAALGGQIALHCGIKTVFVIGGLCLLCNAVWVYKSIYLRKEKKVPRGQTS